MNKQGRTRIVPVSSYPINEPIQGTIKEYIESKKLSNGGSDIDSLWCFKRLSENGLAGKGKWTPKLKGDAPGIILHGDNEHDGKIFVKQLDINECLNFSTLALVKQCGVKSPRVEVKFLDNVYYLFSSDMTEKKRIKPINIAIYLIIMMIVRIL